MFENLKPAAWPFIIGMVVGMALLSFGFGFMSAGTANELAENAAQEAAVAALVPQCVDRARADEVGLAAVLEKPTSQRRTEISQAGWATYPEGASPGLKRAIDQGCVDVLSKS